MDLTGGRNILTNPLSADSGVEQLSRKDKAFKAIDGVEPSFFTRNPWAPALTFDAAMTAQIRRDGGAAFVFGLSDPLDAFDQERMALLWDDEQLADGPRNVAEGDTVVVRIGEPKGNILSVWVTDPAVVVTVKDQQPPNQAALLQKQADAIARQDARIDDAKPNPIMEGFKAILDVQAKVAIAAVLVGGVVLYLWLKKPGGI